MSDSISMILEFSLKIILEILPQILMFGVPHGILKLRDVLNILTDE